LHQEAFKLIVVYFLVGLIITCVTGFAVVLLPCLLAAWAVWHVAAGISGK
jgi:hypothetical protein